MPLYKYIAASRGLAPGEVLIEADSQSESLAKLRSRGMTPVRFCGESDAGAGNREFARRSKIDTYEFTRQLAPLLDSYIPLERALGIIAEGSATAEQRNFVNSLRQGLHEGKKFSELVRAHGRLFPGYYANLIESGEESGCLPQVVQELQRFMHESRELREFIISSSIYPLAILGITLLVTILLFVVFVPRFANIFRDMGRELPPSMLFLTAASTFAAWAWWLIPLLVTALWQFAKHHLGEEDFRFRLNKLLLKLPLAGGIAADLQMCKYLRTLAILLGNHVEIIRSVRISQRVLTNPVIAREFTDIDRKLKGGEKLSAALKGNPFMPQGAVPMLRVGEESGSVGEMLQKIAGNLENDTRRRIKRLLSLFEPAVIVFLAVLVLTVVVSIFVAMMEINSIT